MIKNIPKIKLKGDGLITNKKNIALGILTADCAPVFIFDPIKKVIAVAHAGWKGAYKKILIKIIKKLIILGSKKENIITLNEYFYGKSRLYLCAPLHPKHCIHPIYQWGQAVDLRVDVQPLLKMSINELKVEMKKTPKFLRTIRSNKAPIIIDAEYGMKSEPYNAIDLSLIKRRAKLVRDNEKFSQNILIALKEIAEEKEQSKSQEDIYDEESIYTKFTSNKDTSRFEAWHAASWKDKLSLLDKFEDKRLVGFGKKIIFQEAPEVLPPDIFKTIQRGIAKRILSEKREKWWTVSTCFTEIDTLRDKYSDQNDEEKLKFLDELNEYIMSVQKKYENV